MGSSVSKAREAAGEEKQQVGQLLKVLENKLGEMKLVIQNTRGDNAEPDKTEVTGGRTIMRVSEIRVADKSGPDDQLLTGIDAFFSAAQSSVNGDKGAAKNAAIQGAKSLLAAGINALFGVKDGQAMEKQSFIIIFLNNSFVRVDYYVYAYSVSAKSWGAEANQSGVCYITDMSVLDMSELTSSEIDFLTSQALAIGDGEFDKLMQIKVSLIEVSILSRALKNSDMSFDKLSEITAELGKAHKAISDTFKQFDDYTGPKNPSGPKPTAALPDSTANTNGTQEPSYFVVK